MTIANIVIKCRKLVDATATSYTDANLLIDLNAAYEEIVGMILNWDGRWSFDDTNYGTNPRTSQNLVASQVPYPIAPATYLTVDEVRILDENGDEHKLEQLFQKDFSEPLEELFSTSGRPLYYTLEGDKVRVFPAPSAALTTLTNGLIIHYRRTASVFTSAEVTTGTKVPGFAVPWQKLMCYKAILDYAIAYKSQRVPAFLREIDRLTRELKTFYLNRNGNDETVLAVKPINFR